MIDIHNHIVYGVDDGSKSLDESLKMVDIFMENGFTDIIATSHYDPGRYMVKASEINDKVKVLNEEVKKRGLDFKIYKGHEIQIQPDSLKKIKEGKLLKLNDSRYILLELSFLNKPTFLKDLIYNIELEGLIPIIAHAERYPYVEKNIDYLLEFIKMGALIQANYSSIRSHRDTLTELLMRNMVHILATDSHQAVWRSPNIGDYKKEIADIIGDEKLEVLSTMNPKKVLEDEFLSSSYDYIIKAEDKPKKRSIFSFWRKK
ncbi:CpsB/CapC family capsule biosynthesis tyrosine phosphatase [Anaerococcus porci]|uniref:tyrosine-protein phosphatase n=1 Tax=Anaerococcus porci TaxID=2652269 RepID=UPI002A74EB7D|nr:CpsB/CapC family capsule biosynthesis tyrosine phosphatase [Anaerococcus porci]MDY3006745.1 CpsB/CapC family capsule biosynthesis tyrosine phosphatase [Anaerococcus porci]